MYRLPEARPHILIAWSSVVRGKVGFLIEHWQRICLLTERIVRRREAAAVRLTPVLRPSFLPTHLPLSLPPLSAFASTASSASSTSATAPSSTSGSLERDTDASTTSSIFSGLTAGSRRAVLDGQADLSRLTNTVKSLVEVNERCWRGEECELCAGVRQGLVHVSAHTQRHADALEHRVSHDIRFVVSSYLPHSYLVSRERCSMRRWRR